MLASKMELLFALTLELTQKLEIQNGLKLSLSELALLYKAIMNIEIKNLTF